MPDLTPLVGVLPDKKTIAVLLLLWVLSALLSALFAKKTQIDAWVETKPRLSGVLKILRGAGLDPWLILQGLSLIVKGRLPLALQAAKTKAAAEQSPPSSRTLPGATAVLLFLLAAFCLRAVPACSSSTDVIGASASPLQATVVIERATLGDVTDPEATAGVEFFPACVGVAVDPFRILTARHCLLQSPVYYVDAWTWEHTASGKAKGDSEAGRGEVASVVPREALKAWLPRTERAVDGPAQLVRVRGFDLVLVDTLLTGDHFDAPSDHGDSGGGVFQAGALVGIVQACDDPTGSQCEPTGGRFASAVDL